MMRTALVIGGGVAGMTAASKLSDLGIPTVILEKEDRLGGHLRNWDRLFPTRRPAQEVLDFLLGDLGGKAEIRYRSTISSIRREGLDFIVSLESGETFKGNAILLATGFELFDAHKKEEYGYGIYDNVITSAELEAIFQSGQPVMTRQGILPKRIGFVHCVGSRDEKVGNLYCSKVCCVTGVKQAIEIKEQVPDAEVFGFYMDLRMFDRFFEELYFEAQQKWDINFLRGRVSECAENQDHTIVVKLEDTLTSRPLKMTVDLLVLLVGFVSSPETQRLAGMLGVPAGEDRFLLPEDAHIQSNSTGQPGVFLAGAAKGPVCIPNTIADAGAAALKIYEYLKKL
ncbi:MAG: FAD-dependent oxidoreductase [bacterium]